MHAPRTNKEETQDMSKTKVETTVSAPPGSISYPREKRKLKGKIGCILILPISNWPNANQ